jgi:hypothetical protein
VSSNDVAIGPWALGEDNVHAQDNDVFQQTRRGGGRLLAAENIDLRDDGWPLLREGTVTKLSRAGALSMFSGAGMLLVQFGTQLHIVDDSGDVWASTPIVTKLRAGEPLKYAEHAGNVFWLNSEQTGRIIPPGISAPWGLPLPSAPKLRVTEGNMCHGTYMVAFAYEDEYGVEHGLSEISQQTIGINECTGGGTINTGLLIDAVGIDPRASRIRIYISEANGSELYFVKNATPSELPYAIRTGGYSPWADIQPVGLFMHPPQPGDGLFTWDGSIITYTNNMLFPSLGAAVHLYELGLMAEARPKPVLAGVGLKDGFWTTTEVGAFWTTGPMPSEWDTNQKDARVYAAGGFKLNARLMPALESDEMVALFVCETGLVAGFPGGVLQPLTQDRYHFDVKGKRANFALREQRGMRQVLFTLT